MIKKTIDFWNTIVYNKFMELKSEVTICVPKKWADLLTVQK